MLFELFKKIIIYSDMNIFNIVKKNKRMTIDKATKIIGKCSEIAEIRDEKYYFLDEEGKWNPQHLEGLTIRDLNNEDKKIVDALKKKCKSNEVEMGQEMNLYDILRLESCGVNWLESLVYWILVGFMTLVLSFILNIVI